MQPSFSSFGPASTFTSAPGPPIPTKRALSLLLAAGLLSLAGGASVQAQGTLRLSREYVYAGDRLLVTVGPELPTASYVTPSVAVDESAGAVELTVRVVTGDQRKTRSALTLTTTAGGGTAVAGVNYGQPSPASVTFPVGSANGATQKITVPILDDCVVTPNLWFGVTVTSVPDPTAPTVSGTATVTIVDSDMPVVSLASADAMVREDGTWLTPRPTVRATTSCSVPLPYDLRVPLSRVDETTQGADDLVIGTSSPVFFGKDAPSGSEVDLEVAPVPDEIIEGPEVMRVELAAGEGYRLGTGTVRVTIQDDDVSPPLGLYRVSPCRLADTRTTGGPLSSGMPRTFQVSGSCGVPPDARAVVLGIAAIAPTANGNLSVYYPGIAPPRASAVNFASGDVRSAGGHFLLDPQGRIEVLARLALPTGTVHVVLDVTGYFQ